MLRLQETAGNRAVADVLGAVAPSVQRHYRSRTKHEPHTGKDKSHSKADAEAAGSDAQQLAEEAKRLAEQAKGATSASKAASVLERLREISEVAPSLYDVVNTCSDESTKQLWRRKTQTARDQVVGALGSASMAEEGLARREDETKVTLNAPSHLARIEGSAIEVAGAATQALGASTTAAAARALAKGESAMGRLMEVKGRFDTLVADVGRFPQVRAQLRPHGAAIDAAVTMAQRMLAVCSERQTALALIDKKKAGLAAYQRAQEEVREAEETVALARQNISDLQAYAVVALPALAEVGARRGFDYGAQQATVTAELAHAHQQQLAAEAYLAQCRDDLAATEKIEQHDVDAAEAGAAAAALAHRTGPASPASTEEELVQVGHARSLAGGAAELASLSALLPDRTELIALLEAVGATVAQRWLEDPKLGPAVVRGHLAVAGGPGLKKLVDDVGGFQLDGLLAALAPLRLQQLADDGQLGGAQLKDLAWSFAPLEIDVWATAFGLPELKALLAKISAAKLKKLDLAPAALKAALAEVDLAAMKTLVDVVGETRVKDYFTELTPEAVKNMLTQLPAAVLQRLDLTGADLKDLLSQFTAAELKQLATELGDPALKDLLSKFPAADLKAYRTTVGPARLTELVTVKKLKADALHRYGAAFLKTFVGANNATMNHLVTAHFNAEGKVSGAHDEQVFLAFINRRYAGGQQRYGSITHNPGAAAVYSVLYETYAADGTVMNTGSKTLIQGLVGSRAAWQERFNAGIWEAIRALTFPAAGGNFAASVGGLSCAGYYNAGTHVDTVYPT